MMGISFKHQTYIELSIPFGLFGITLGIIVYFINLNVPFNKQGHASLVWKLGAAVTLLQSFDDEVLSGLVVSKFGISSQTRDTSVWVQLQLTMLKTLSKYEPGC